MNKIKWPDGTETEVPANQPIILLGPNGVGKTRFAVALAQRNSADRISANRHIGLTGLPRQRDEDLKSNADSAMNSQLSEYWNVHNEYTFLMSQILEEDKSSAQKYRDRHRKGQAIPPELSETRLTKITGLWHSLFPGRTITLDYTPMVVKQGSPDPYPTAQMSEGERTALYLITRLVSSHASIVIIDEPEIHFHPMLARHFWNAMEAYKPDTLFIYVTHDIPFALSRRKPQIHVIRSADSFDTINDANIPSDAINTILGAASFSITATRLIFCEGVFGGDEHKLFSAWYNCPNTAVIPVGGCDNVRKCVDVFNAEHATKNVSAFGHIDRDDWGDNVLNANEKIKPLPINEIEGIICFEPVFKALAASYGYTNGDARYREMLVRARNTVSRFILQKHALNRAKLILESKQQELRNGVKPHADLAVMRQNYLAAAPTATDAAAILDKEIADLTAALAGNELLLKFPSKTYHEAAFSQLQVATDKAFEDVCTALKAEDASLEEEATKKTLKAALIAGLEDHFFSRQCS